MGRLALVLSLLLGMSSLALGMDPSGPDPLDGVVREPSGEAVPAAQVSLLEGGRILASGRTDRAGRFQLRPRTEPTGELRLRVERLGYHTYEETLEAGASWVEVVVQPAPLPLPGFEVEAPRDLCEREEDQKARALWEAASRLHPGGLDTMGVATYLQGWTDTLVATSSQDEERVGAPGQRGSAPLLRLSWDRRIQRDGYAFSVRRSDRERSYDSWSYPPLEADFAPHFLDQTFGRLHRFQLEPDGPEGWTLRFCGRERDDPYLEGRLELSGDTLLHRAEWHFVTPEPDEAAGGWARFPPGTTGEAPPLPLPVESMTWKRLPDGETIRKAQSYEGWILAPGDSVPFLRSRSPDRQKKVPPGGP